MAGQESPPLTREQLESGMAAGKEAAAWLAARLAEHREVLGDAAFALLQQAGSRLESQSEVTAEGLAAYIARAREEYGSTEIEIDSDAALSIGDDGAWVQAWVWLGNGDEDEEDEG